MLVFMESSHLSKRWRILETDINYYARVNFSSLIKIVDEIGGIDVDNPVSFQQTITVSPPAHCT